MTIVGISHIARRTIRNSAQPAEQGQLVGRGLVVVEDNVAKQRQRAGAIVREADDELCPVESAAPEFILALSCYLDESSVFPRKPFNFGLRDGVNAALGLRRPGTQCDC